jgi:DNA gyrase subunit B
MQDMDHDSAQEPSLPGGETAFSSIRRWPVLYVGSESWLGLHYMVHALVNNSVAEAAAGYCTHIAISIAQDDVVTVEDDGRGIALDLASASGRSTLELLFTDFKVGPRRLTHTSRYQALDSAGLPVVNALSTWLRVEAGQNGVLYGQEFADGVPATPLQRIGSAASRGTRISFLPLDMPQWIESPCMLDSKLDIQDSRRW